MQVVDGVAAVARAAVGLEVGAARLGVLAGDPPDLDHRQRRAVGQHDGHLQQRADLAADLLAGVRGEGLGAVAALQQERLAARDGGQPLAQRVALLRLHQRRHLGQDLHDVGSAAGSGQAGCWAAGRSRQASRSRGHAPRYRPWTPSHLLDRAQPKKTSASA